MAVKSTLTTTSLTLKYKEGLDATGKDIIKSKKFSTVKVTADNQSIFDVSQAISPLMKYPVTQVLRSDDNLLTNV
jgi:Protein of unknown function (DUF1659).